MASDWGAFDAAQPRLPFKEGLPRALRDVFAAADLEVFELPPLYEPSHLPEGNSNAVRKLFEFL
jgi:hypothetical protein